MYEAWHECQTCGEPLRRMTREEEDIVAQNPYNYIFYCGNCIRKGWNRDD